MGSINLKTAININSPAERVWRALTDPEIIKKYFFDTNVESAWQKGSPIIWSGEWQGKTYQDRGTILDIVPGQYVKYSYWSSMSGTDDKPENYQQVSYELFEKDAVTKLEIVQENIKNEEAKQHSEQNWQAVFGKMKQMIEDGLIA